MLDVKTLACFAIFFTINWNMWKDMYKHCGMDINIETQLYLCISFESTILEAGHPLLLWFHVSLVTEVNSISPIPPDVVCKIPTLWLHCLHGYNNLYVSIYLTLSVSSVVIQTICLPNWLFGDLQGRSLMTMLM